MSHDPIDRLLSPEDREAIRQAVKSAEGDSSAEIVTAVADRSDAYPEVLGFTALFTALAFAALSTLIFQVGGFWDFSLLRWSLAPTLVGALLGYALPRFFPSLIRFLATNSRIDERVHHAASLTFLEHRVFETANRTGILLYISLLEHQVLLLADEGIEAVVPQEAWDQITHDLAGGLREGRPGPALVQAVEGCASILVEYGMLVQEHDENELPDGVRTRRLEDS